jgi:hypothetical protein
MRAPDRIGRGVDGFRGQRLSCDEDLRANARRMKVCKELPSSGRDGISLLAHLSFQAIWVCNQRPRRLFPFSLPPGDGHPKAPLFAKLTLGDI